VAKILPFLPFPELSDPVPAQVPDAAPPDAAARALALEIRRSFIVEAPAGSGKTGLLIQRFLKLLADPDPLTAVTQPEQVLAITFTLKATAELRDRVLNQLEQAAAGTPTSSPFATETRAFALAVLDRDRQLGWDLLSNPRRLNIRTIDSVCAEIARTLPVLSGSGGALAPATDAAPLYREAARRTLLLLGGPDPQLDRALRTLLLHRDASLADCETLLADMLAVREQWATLVPRTAAESGLDDDLLDAEVLPRLQQALEHAICAKLTTLANAFPAGVLAELTALAAEMADSPGYKGQLSPIALCRERAASPAALAEDLEHWRALAHLILKPSKPRSWRKSVSRNVVGFEIEKHHEQRLKELIAQLGHRDDLIDLLGAISALPPATYPADQWLVARALFRVLNRALIELQLVFAGRTQCDFAELSLLARAALAADSGPEDLTAALGARLQHLLVDEMQDTSTGQYDLIQLLTASWDGHSQTVFLVGDPRQSIYLFRQANVARFLRTLHTRTLGDLPLTRLRLTANFRSQRALVDGFNRDFALIFPPEDPLPYTPADATLPPNPEAQALTWHLHPIPTARALAANPDASGRAASLPEVGSVCPLAPELTAPQLRQLQSRRNARQILRTAREWLARPLPANRPRLANGEPEPWRLAVLVRNRSHLTDLVAALKSSPNPIPYRAVEIEPLAERPEVLDLTALTRALLHPADRVAALAILRAPWCGLSLADLHTLTGAETDPALARHSIPRLLAERGHLLPDDSGQRLQRVWTALTSARAQRARATAAQLVERTWRTLGGPAPLTKPDLINCRRFFELLDELEASGEPLDPVVLQTRLQRLYAEPNPIPDNRPFLELLTIHNAKGLEWDLVMVPALERGPARDRQRLLTWAELDPGADREASHFLLAPIAARGEDVDPLTTWLKRLYRDREAAERKRLVYVAATRARHELHLFATPDLPANGIPNARYNTLLKAAWPAAEPHLPAPATQPDVPSIAPLSLAIAGPSPRSVTTLPPQPFALNLAAAAGPTTSTPITLHRLPLDYAPAPAPDPLPYGEPNLSTALPTGPQPVTTPTTTRPEGSLAARALGTVVHTLLEHLAARLAAGTPASALLAELPSWTPRVAALLRAEGLPTATVADLTRDARTLLANLLRDPEGLWLLAPHPAAASELALTAATPDGLASIRIDRTFHAGPTPQSPPDPDHPHLWIVDFKTASHSQSGLEAFLARERATYAPQLATYAQILSHPGRPDLGLLPNFTRDRVRLALYYPAIPRLLWWPLTPQPQTPL
jgi:ATP-dependent exoDNAse (exonuclease V) beta subunit